MLTFAVILYGELRPFLKIWHQSLFFYNYDSELPKYGCFPMFLIQTKHIINSNVNKFIIIFTFEKCTKLVLFRRGHQVTSSIGLLNVAPGDTSNVPTPIKKVQKQFCMICITRFNQIFLRLNIIFENEDHFLFLQNLQILQN